MPRMPASTLSVFTLAALAAFSATPGYAAPVLGSSTAAQVGAVVGTQVPYASPGYVNSRTSVSDSTGTASGYSFANEYGAYAVSSNAEGLASSGSAHSQLTYTLTNTSGVAQSYTMFFHIYSGSISTYMNSSEAAAALVGGESMGASYAASIKVNGTRVFYSAAGILTTDAGSAFTLASGPGTTRLNDGGDDGTDGYYSWGAGDYAIDLGIVAAGSSIDVLAEVDDAATANVGTYSYTTTYCGYGNGYGNGYGDGYGDGYGGGYEECVPQTETVTQFKGGGRAFYGDPVQFDSTGAESASPPTPVSFTVPEPSSLPLALLALLGGGWAARRRRGA